jgi:hypothetical protein
LLHASPIQIAGRFSPLVVLPVELCVPNVLFLGAFVSAGQKQNQSLPELSKVHAVSRSEINPKLENTFANRLAIASIPLRQPVDSNENPSNRRAISERLNPFPKYGLACFGDVTTNLDHDWIVIYISQALSIDSGIPFQCAFPPVSPANLRVPRKKLSTYSNSPYNEN